MKDELRRLIHPKLRLRVENPNGRRKSFRVRYTDPTNKWHTLNTPEVEAVNKLFLSGSTPFYLAKESLKQYIQTFYHERDKGKRKPPFVTHNLAIVDRLWDDKYTARRKLEMKRPEESLHDYKLAAWAAGDYPLDTCSLESLEGHLFKELQDRPNILKRRITWINSILSWLGRPKIKPPLRRNRPEIVHLTEDEFKTLLPYLHKQDQVIATIAFYTGLRLGEIFGIQFKHIKDRWIVVNQQMTDDLLITSTKTDNERKAFYPSNIRDLLDRWAAVPLTERHESRKRTYSKVIKKACQKAFPTNTDKNLRFHDLRHSNAIWLLSKGATLTEVANHLGNHQEVTERHYAGFSLKEGNINRLSELTD